AEETHFGGGQIPGGGFIARGQRLFEPGESLIGRGEREIKVPRLIAGGLQRRGERLVIHRLQVRGDFRFGLIRFQGREGGLHVGIESRSSNGRNFLQRRIFERTDIRGSLEEFQRVALKRAAQLLGLEITPLVSGLGLKLRTQGAVVLGAGHLARGESGQQRGDNGHDDGRGGEDFAPSGLGHVLLQFFRNRDFHGVELWFGGSRGRGRRGWSRRGRRGNRG